MKRAMTQFTVALLAILQGSTALAASPLQLSSDVFVEKTINRADGSRSTILEEPKLVTPGDNLVFVVKYKNTGTAPAENFVVTNPLPAAVAFNGTSNGLEVVSIDGGKSWGFLPALRVKNATGKQRPALMSDVTHIRWNFNQPLASGSEGKLIFRGIVR